MPDGTPITAESKSNDTTRAYYNEKVILVNDKIHAEFIHSGGISKINGKYLE
ncbi:hypothetical protein J7E73_28445 [Paenibacillus albidus]|uniref:hypothetical protein n=1 Tax=Paenibacillus albidus TaxID=2041023 RepID=UPI001BE4FCB9|nr:hypothetical protein [Paenibacillus albidus]MBT2292975.1 hypothetical protein [Paenibacillus albidus]